MWLFIVTFQWGMWLQFLKRDLGAYILLYSLSFTLKLLSYIFGCVDPNDFLILEIIENFN